TGKTGYTKRAKRTLVTTAKKDDMELIAVTLNSEGQGDWSEHISMFEHVFSNYKYKVVLKNGIISKVKETPYENRALLEHSFVYPVTKDEEDQFKVEYRLLTPKREWRKNISKVPEIIG